MAREGGRYYVDEDGQKRKLAPGEKYPTQAEPEPEPVTEDETEDTDQ